MAKTCKNDLMTQPSAERLAEGARAAAKGGLPPVHLWDPPFCGDMDMRIARDGTWIHEGGPIRRPELVRLFSTILKREEGKYFLVTPVEKLGIEVEDAPFMAVDFEASGAGEAQILTFETNVGDFVAAGPEHPIRVVQEPGTDAPCPYVMVRAGLEARIDRKSFYRLAELGVDHDVAGEGWFGVWSGGAFFPVIPSGALED